MFSCCKIVSVLFLFILLVCLSSSSSSSLSFASSITNSNTTTSATTILISSSSTTSSSSPTNETETTTTHQDQFSTTELTTSLTAPSSASPSPPPAPSQQQPSSSSSSSSSSSTTTATTALNFADLQALITVDIVNGFTVKDVYLRIAQLLGISSHEVRIVGVRDSAAGLVLIEFRNQEDVKKLLSVSSARLSSIGVVSAAPAPGADSGFTTASPSGADALSSSTAANSPSSSSSASDSNNWIIYVCVTCGIIIIAFLFGIYFYKKSGPNGAGRRSGVIVSSDGRRIMMSEGGDPVTMRDYMQTYATEMSAVTSGGDMAIRSRATIERNAGTSML